VTTDVVNKQATLMKKYRALQDHMTAEERAAFDRMLFIPSEEIKRYKKDIVAFAKEVLKFPINKYQARALEALVEHRRVCVRGPHSMGKSALSAIAVLWFVTVHEECKVLTTASVWRQLTVFLWPEIHKWATSAKAEWWRVGLTIRPGKELNKTELSLGANRFAKAVASSDETKIEGAHSEYILYVFDEAKAIPTPIWDAAEGALASHNAYALAVSTPGDSVGRFYDIQQHKKGYEDWHVLQVTLEDAIEAGRIDPAWVSARRTSWGENSVLFRRRVKGEFADDDAETVITLGQVEAAQNRWYKFKEQEEELIKSGVTPSNAEIQVWGKMSRIGVDPARYGDDSSGFAFRHEANRVKGYEQTEKKSTMETAGTVKQYLDDDHAVTAFIDVNGLGAGVYDKLEEDGCNVIAIQSSNKTNLRDKTGFYQFYQYRDWLWWNMRDLLSDEKNEVALPPGDEVSQDLVAAHYTILSNGKIKVSSKDDMRKIIGRSPDVGEAIIMTFGEEKPPYKPLIGFL